MSDKLLVWMKAMPSAQDVAWQIEKAEAIKAWCLRTIGFKVGDRVQIVEDVVPHDYNSGWRCYREALAIGQTGIVTDIDFNPHSFNREGAWYAMVRLDHEWSVGSQKHEPRYWHGSVSTTPPGFVEPSKYDQENYPEGKHGLFSINVGDLKLAAETVTAPGGVHG